MGTSLPRGRGLVPGEITADVGHIRNVVTIQQLPVFAVVTKLFELRIEFVANGRVREADLERRHLRKEIVVFHCDERMPLLLAEVIKDASVNHNHFAAAFPEPAHLFRLIRHFDVVSSFRRTGRILRLECFPQLCPGVLPGKNRMTL